MNNLVASLNYTYSPFGKNLAGIAEYVLPLVERAKTEKLKPYEYDGLVRSLWVVYHVTTKKGHSKLDGGCSVSTDCHACGYCRKMWEKALKEIAEKGDTNIICSRCYSDTDGKCHRGLANRNMLNAEILSVDIPQQAWDEAFTIYPFEEFYRNQSFGETDTVQEAMNLIRITRTIGRKYDIPSAVWSKNSPVWGRAFELEGKPDNMTYVQSSPRINVRTPIAPCIKKWCDHRFTVFDEEFLRKHPEIKINCGGESCRNCVKQRQRCYFHGGEFDINEKLK